MIEQYSIEYFIINYTINELRTKLIKSIIYQIHFNMKILL